MIVILNLKKRSSGVSTTILALQPILEDLRADIFYFGSGVKNVKRQLTFLELVRQCFIRTKDSLVLHARRDHEIIFSLILRAISLRPIKIVFTWAAQRPKGWFTNMISRQVDCMIATSVGASKFTPLRANIIQHGVNISAQPVQKDLTIPKIAIIGRVRPEKGTDVFVKALLENLHHDFHAYIIGEVLNEHKPFSNELKSLIQSRSACSKFEWINYMPHNELLNFLKEIHVVVACPRYEGFGLTLFEGAAAGCAIIGTKTGAFPELIGNDEQGYLIPCNDVSALQLALEKLLSNPQKIADFGQQAQGYVKQHYTIEKEAEKLACLYDSMLKNTEFKK